MKKLYINHELIGTVKTFRNRGGSFDVLTFLMVGGFFVSVDSVNIQSFDDRSDFLIITYG